MPKPKGVGILRPVDDGVAHLHYFVPFVLSLQDVEQADAQIKIRTEAATTEVVQAGAIEFGGRVKVVYVGRQCRQMVKRLVLPPLPPLLGAKFFERQR